MRRTAHALKGNKTSEAPHYFCFLDTETLPYPFSATETEHRFRLGWACFWRRARYGMPEETKWVYLDSKPDIWRHIDEQLPERQRLCIIAHNTGFDLQVVGGLRALHDNGWTITKGIIDDPPFILQARKGTRSLYILDWYNYFRGSLAQAGALLGVPKLLMPDFGDSDAAWSHYCRNDTLVLLRAMQRYLQFLTEYDLGAFAPTLAAQSLNAYRHRFMESRIYVHTDEKVIALEREAYYGGRVELFYKGELRNGPYAYVDINSAYAYVMREQEFPTALVTTLHNITPQRLAEVIDQWQAVARVELVAESPLYPMRMDSRLVFPVGGYSTTLATPELRVALSKGHVKSVSECAVYRRAPIFQKWVREMAPLRTQAIERGENLWEELLKRMTNSLFGKFGQRNHDWEMTDKEDVGEDRIWVEHNLDTGESVTYRCIAGVVQVRTGMREGYNSFVSIAAHVTSAARVLLLQYMQRAGFSHVYYCDTDSLIVDKVGYERLLSHLHPTELGRLKLVGWADRVELLAPKNYRFGDHVRHKGRRGDAIDVGDGTYEQDMFQSLTGALRMGWHGGPVVRRVRKHDVLAYHKGTVGEDGKVYPLRFRRSVLYNDSSEVPADNAPSDARYPLIGFARGDVEQ